MQVTNKSFEELTLDEFYEILRLRAEIFVVEQNCVYNDLDDRDQFGRHVFGTKDHKIVAYARVLPENTRFKEVSIGRVVVNSNYRGLNLGKVIMNASIQVIKNSGYQGGIRISAQCYLLKFYTELGFEVVSEEYLEDGIPHVEMIYRK